MTGNGILRVVPAAKRIQVRNRPERRLGAVAAPSRGLAGADGVPARLMLPMKIAAAEDEVRLRPDDLRAQLEAAVDQRGGHLAGMQAGVPDVHHTAREELKIGRAS